MISYKYTLSFFLASALVLNANDGFDDEFAQDEIKIVEVKKEKENDFSYYGDVSFLSSYNFSHKKPINNQLNDFRGLSSTKLSSNLNLQYKINDKVKIKSILSVYKDFIYDLKSDEYKTTPKDYDESMEIKELYIQGKINKKVDITFGKQIIVWGKSDNIRITDIINSLDNTSPGMIDIKDLRQAEFITKIDYFINTQWSINTIIQHENSYTSLPAFGSDYAPSNIVQASMNKVDEPKNNLENTGVSLAINGNLEGQDVSMYYSNQYMDNTTYRSNMLGFAYNKVINSYLLKTELAYFDNYDNVEVESKIDSLVGLEYNGISDGSVSLEIANKNNTIQYALRFTQSYINSTLDFSTLYSAFGQNLNEGGFLRVWFDYDINDKVSSNFGFIDYKGGNTQFDMIENNDRLFASAKYSF